MGRNIARFTIEKPTYGCMRTYATTHKVTMCQLALAAVAIALQHDAHDCDITIGAPYLNRHCEEDNHVVGLFLEPLLIRIKYPSY
jgi:non-ribosomal peptide synthetase component F